MKKGDLDAQLALREELGAAAESIQLPLPRVVSEGMFKEESALELEFGGYSANAVSKFFRSRNQGKISGHQ